jgi:hypothetical protein
MRVMAMRWRASDGNKGNGNGNRDNVGNEDWDKVDGQQRRKGSRVARAIAKAMRGAGTKEGKGSKAMAMATRVVGDYTATATKKAMATKTREVNKEEGNGKGNKNNGDGKEDGRGEQ